ncbi:MAG: hypothetical protein AB7G87_01310 [Clostridia bacterium]
MGIFLKKRGEGILTGLLWFGAVAVAGSVIALALMTQIASTGNSAENTIDGYSQQSIIEANKIP